jgi:hypothetical protein
MYDLIKMSEDYDNESDDDIIQQALIDQDSWFSYYIANIRMATYMRAFLYLDNAQWTSGELADRNLRGKVSYQNNMTAAIIRKLVSEERAAAPQSTVIPIDSNIPTKVTKVKTKLNEQIAYESRSDMVYATCYADMLEIGWGQINLQAVKETTTSFHNVLRITKPEDVLYSYWDSSAEHENKIDGDFAGYYFFMPKKRAEMQYKESDIVSLGLPQNWGATYMSSMRKDVVVLACHYRRCYGEITMVKLDDGAEMPKKVYTIVVKELKQQYKKQLSQYAEMISNLENEATERGLPKNIINDIVSKIPKPTPAEIPKITKTQVCMDFVIEQLILSKNKVLERTKLPIKVIPQFYVGGDNKKVNGMEIPQPYAANAVMPQRQINLICSEQFDNIGRSYGLRCVAHEDSVSGKEQEYQRPSISNLMTFKTVDGSDENSQTSSPKFVYVSGVDPNLLGIYQQAQQDLKTVLGRYNENLGDESNAYGYEAILNRQLNGDIASGIFPDNLNKAIAEVNKAAMDWMPFVYDTERSVLVRNKDGKTEFVTINRPTGEEDGAGNLLLENDMRIGRYTVEVYGGLSFAAQRLAGMQFLNKMFDMDDELKHDLFDLYLEMAPFPFTNEAIKRLKETGYINPEVVAEDEGEPAPKPKPNPVQILAKLKMMSEIESIKTARIKSKADALKSILEFKKDIANAKIEADKEVGKAKADAEKAKAELAKEEVDLLADTVESYAEIVEAESKAQSEEIENAMKVVEDMMDREMVHLSSIETSTKDEV